MSGIAGIIDFHGRPVDPHCIKSMTRSLAHRGPDGIGYWSEFGQHLGFCALHTTPESVATVQPLVSDDGNRVLVMDGRLDNWEQLRSALGEPSAVDARLAMLAFERWGDQFASHLDGDFAIAIWDRLHQQLHCARDMFASRPFYYHWSNGRFTFASEIGAMAKLPWVSLTFNEGMLVEFLSFAWLSRTETFWNEINRLEPRHHLRVVKDGIRDTVYWEPNLTESLGYRTDDEYIEHYRSIYSDAVRRISRSQFPVAFEVSGGLDSSAVYAQAIELKRQGKLLAPAMRGYTLEFPAGTPADELEFAMAVGCKTKSIVTPCPATYEPMSWYRAEAERRLDIPVAANSVMMSGLIETAVKDGARVLIGGSGGDEWTGVGTNGLYYADILKARDWSSLKAALLNDFQLLGVSKTLWWLARHGFAGLLPDDIINMLHTLLSNDKLQSCNWLQEPYRILLKSRRIQNRTTPTKTVRPSQRLLLNFLDHASIGLCTERHEFWLAGKGVECRNPYKNRTMVQFAFSTSEWMRQRGTRHRWLHREALGPLLPEKVRERPDKADFMLAIITQNQEIRDSLGISLPERRRDWIQMEYFERVLHQHPDPVTAGLDEWLLWYLSMCDVLELHSRQ